MVTSEATDDQLLHQYKEAWRSCKKGGADVLGEGQKVKKVLAGQEIK